MKPKVAKPSQSDLIRSHISSKLDQNYDYSSLSNKRLDIDEFCKAHNITNPKIIKNIGKLHNKMLKDVLNKRNISPASVGLEKRIPSMRGEGGIDATIEPKPQQSKAPITTQDPKQQPTTTTQTGLQTQPIIPVVQVFDEEGVKATVHAFYLGIASFFPDAEDLSAQEQTSLGKMWTPIFNKYLSEKMEIIITVVATAGMMIPKLNRARKLNKAKQPKDKIETKEEISETKKTETPKESTPEIKDLSEQDAKDKVESDKISKMPLGEAWDE